MLNRERAGIRRIAQSESIYETVHPETRSANAIARIQKRCTIDESN